VFQLYYFITQKKNMKRIIGLILLLSVLIIGFSSSLNHEKLYKGELFIKLITFGSDFFSIEDENGVTMYETLDAIEDKSVLSKQEKELKEYFDLLKENDLIGKPYFHLTTQKSNAEFITVYVDESEYEKIKDFKLSELEKNNQKVLIKLYGEAVSENIIKCNHLKSVKLVKGETQWKK